MTSSKSASPWVQTPCMVWNKDGPPPHVHGVTLGRNTVKRWVKCEGGTAGWSMYMISTKNVHSDEVKNKHWDKRSTRSSPGNHQRDRFSVHHSADTMQGVLAQAVAVMQGVTEGTLCGPFTDPDIRNDALICHTGGLVCVQHAVIRDTIAQ